MPGAEAEAEMSEYSRTVYPMECDYNRFLPPSAILRQALDYILEDIKRDGCDRSVIYPKCGAVWMISRMRFYQYRNITAGEVISYHTFPRVIENGHYIFYVEIFCADELVVRFDTVFIPVNAAERKVMSVERLEPLWTAPPRQAQSKYLVRLDMDCEYVKGGKQTVRLSDCDSNRHLTSPGYLALICDELRFWGGEPQLMEFMQVDYASEVMPGTELSFEVGERGGDRLIRGYKPDGKLAFSSMCRFRPEK